MELTLVKAEESGWRGRGAPRREAPPHIIELLQRAAATGQVGLISTDDLTDAQVREIAAALRAGGRQIGRRVRIQRDDDKAQLRFRVGDPS